jgi:hypothetical protein
MKEREKGMPEYKPQSRRVIWETLLMAICLPSLLELVAVVNYPTYQNLAARLSVQQTIFIGEARLRELGILLSEITHPEGHEVSDDSLLTDRNGTFVFVEDYELEHTFHRVAVTALPVGNGRNQINGLFPGDKMVVKGSSRLRWEPDVRPKLPETNCS